MTTWIAHTVDDDTIICSLTEDNETLVSFGSGVKIWLTPKKLVELIGILEKEKAALLGATIQNKLKSNFITKAGA